MKINEVGILLILSTSTALQKHKRMMKTAERAQTTPTYPRITDSTLLIQTCH